MTESTRPSPESADTARALPWHAAEAGEVLRRLACASTGLSAASAAERLERVGPNRLPEQPAPPWWQILLRQFRSPLIYILALAAVLALAIGEIKDSAFIAAVLLINALIGAFEEAKAEKSNRALKKLMKVHATVIRDGELVDLDAEQLVPGDVVRLESGARVPADMRLLGGHGLEVDESLLTGESTAAVKDPQWLGDASTPQADRRNMVFAGTSVVHGRSYGAVVATGAASAVGQLALDIQARPQGHPPLVERMERFSRRIAVAVLLSAAIIAAIGMVAHQQTAGQMLLFAIALAVSAIPEGLPVAMTVALAVATTRMARRGVIVRRLAAVEGLGSCTLIGSDKTGTLTCNALTVRHVRLADGSVYDVSGEGYAPDGQVRANGIVIEAGAHGGLDALARAAVLCNEADLHQRRASWTWRGDPTEIALLSLAHKLGWRREATLARYPEVTTIPFEPERRYAASYHRLAERLLVAVKGAPERVAPMCELSAVQRDTLRAAAEEMAATGFRVLMLADGEAPLQDSAALPREPAGLRALGLVGMIDPLRPGVVEAIAACERAGIRTLMITGDHPVTALAIARELGLTASASEVVTGTDLFELPPEQLRRLIDEARVFARVAPHQKLELVQAAQAAGHFVAVTGDGVNDAPALRAANIGVAMGRDGTDVAREAAELVITDDHFATITAGVEEGRVAYDNVRKVIYLLVSTGAAEVVLVGLAVAVGMPLPLLPAQLLWLNLVTNGIQDVALAFEPGEAGVLRRAPRPPREAVFNRLMIERTLLAALVMGCVGFFAFKWMLDAGWSEAAARNALLMLMVLFENIHILNCRSETASAFSIPLRRSPILVLSVVAAFSLHLLMLYLPSGQALLGTAPLSLEVWLVLLPAALSVLLAMELHKLTWRVRQRD